MHTVRRRTLWLATLWLATAFVFGACAGGGEYVSPATLAATTSSSTTSSTSTTSTSSSTTTAPTTTSTTAVTVAVGIQERSLALPGSSVVLRYDDGPTPGALTAIEDALAIAREDFGDSGPLVVHAYGGTEAFVAAHEPRAQQQARADVEAGIIASTSAGVIWIYAPRFVERDAAARKLIVLHEYFHSVQVFLSSGRSGRLPVWLREGSARYFELRDGADHGLADFARRRATEIRVSRPIESLQSLEAAGGATFRGDTGEAYVLGFLATEFLVDAAGLDVVMHDFWRALRTGTDWHTVFANVFGTTVDQFYTDFEAYRLTL